VGRAGVGPGSTAAAVAVDTVCPMAYALDVPPPPLGPGLGRIVVGRAGGEARDVMSSYKIRVDGGSVQKLRARQYVVFDQPSGHYTVDARVGWTGSPEVGVDVFAGSIVHLRVEPAGSLLTAYLRSLTPRGYLSLTVVEPPTASQPPATG
jgi:hypothetical protein